MDIEKTWSAMMVKVNRMPRTPERVEVETQTGTCLYRNIDEALSGEGEPVAEIIFEGEELALWQDFMEEQATTPARAAFDTEHLRALLADPEAAAQKLTATINRQLVELLPPLKRFLETADGPAVATLRGVRDQTSLWLYQDETGEGGGMALTRRDAALLELLADVSRKDELLG